MKITEETKVKDLIPEGYEFLDTVVDAEKWMVTIRYKPKEKKDFDWYCDKYFETKRYISREGAIKMISSNDSNNLCAILNKQYDSATFEIKIGLLKFICDDIKLPVDVYLSKEYSNSPEWGKEVRLLKSICPPEFLNSIFK